MTQIFADFFLIPPEYADFSAGRILLAKNLSNA
jgi:hypothetical protein